VVTGNIHIKRADKNDAQLLSDLSNITFIETYRGNFSDEDLSAFMDDYFNETAIAEELQNADDFYYIAFINGFPAGYMRLKEDDAEYPLSKKYKAIHLKRIYVLKEYHSKKIGAALMSFALRFAAEKNYEMMWLGVWEHNQKAKLFYKKWGFTDIGDSHNFPIGNTPQTDNWLIKFIEKS
jgi:ribosomal protein S18 acetylase RimI-like enzyme